jgi:hypothetical protein
MTSARALAKRSETSRSDSLPAKLTDHDQRQSQSVERGDRGLDALVRHQLRDEHVVLADRTGRESLGIHWGVDDVGLAAEVGPQPGLGGA